MTIFFWIFEFLMLKYQFVDYTEETLQVDDKREQDELTFDESKHSDGKSTDIGEGGPEPSFWFYNEQRKALKVDYRDFIMPKADRWGKTVPIMEKGTLAILPHEEVAKEMESFCERWTSNSIYRGNDLGLGRLAPTLFMDLPPKSYMTLSKL